MTFRSLLPYIAAAVLLLAIVVFVMTFLRPEMRAGRDAVAQAEQHLPRAHERLASIAGDKYEQNAVSARKEVEMRLESARTDLERRGSRLSARFQRLESKDLAKLPGDEFIKVYEFYEDELTRDLAKRLKSATGRDPPLPFPYARPIYALENRQPAGVAEMEAAQKLFTVQSLLLRTAAAKGAVPVEPLRMREDAPAWDTLRKFREIEVTLVFSVEDRQMPALLRALVEIEGEVPLVRVSSVSTRPRPLPKHLEEGVVPGIEARIGLVLVEYVAARSAADGASR